MLIKIIDNYSYKPEEFIATPVVKKAKFKLYFGDQKNFPDELSCFYPYLSDMEISRSKRFIKKSDERVYVITHALVNRKISELLGKNFNRLKINYFDNKKPHVEGSTIDFNLSHSSDYFAYAISNNKNIFIGVDIELIKEKLDIEPIVNRYFHKNEISYILNNNLSSLLQRLRFYEVWTRKEAFFKMLGIGLTEELSEIDLTPGEREITIQDNSSFDVGKFNKIYVYTLKLFDQLILSLSINSPVTIIPIKCNIF